VEQKEKKPVRIPTMEEVESERDRYRFKKLYHSKLKSTIAILVVAAAAAILLATLIFPVMRIYGSSMSPTLQEGQIVVALKTENLETGDLAAFYYGNKLLIKRVIAGPEDIVDIDSEGRVSVNGELLDEPYVSSQAVGECDITFPYEVPEEHWFMMGDNRAVSVDSRSSQLGSVSREQISGKVILRVWPLTAFGPVE
jgi:signal peptidase I